MSGRGADPAIETPPRPSTTFTRERGIEMAPSLVVEILSPTSGSIDLVKKPARYGDFGIPEYWVLDPDERCAWVWRYAAGSSEPERVEGRLEWRPAGASEPLVIDVANVLKPI